MKEVQEILFFWFGKLESEDAFPFEKAEKWFQGGPDFDHEIKIKFGDLLETPKEDFKLWCSPQRGRLALIILLDQFRRNVFKGSRKAFERDGEALQLCLEGIERGQDSELKPVERVFFYMPFMHSEELAMQDWGVELYESLANQVSPSLELPIRNNLDYMKQHQRIIARFGRFPHRNKILGRESTAEETDFLSQPGSSF